MAILAADVFEFTHVRKSTKTTGFLIANYWSVLRVDYIGVPLIHRLISTEDHILVTDESGGQTGTPGMVYLIDTDNPTYFTRVAIWEDAIRRWNSANLDHKILGLGINSVYDNARNDFLGLFTQVGPLAAATFLILITHLGISLLKLMRMARESYQKRLAWVGLATLIAYLFMAIAYGNVLMGENLMWYFAIFWGLSLANLRQLKKLHKAEG